MLEGGGGAGLGQVVWGSDILNVTPVLYKGSKTRRFVQVRNDSVITVVTDELKE